MRSSSVERAISLTFNACSRAAAGSIPLSLQVRHPDDQRRKKRVVSIVVVPFGFRTGKASPLRRAPIDPVESPNRVRSRPGPVVLIGSKYVVLLSFRLLDKPLQVAQRGAL